MNLAPRLASLMVLLSKSLVSRRLAAGDPVSSKQVKRSPPTVILTLCVSFLAVSRRKQMLHKWLGDLMVLYFSKWIDRFVYLLYRNCYRQSSIPTHYLSFFHVVLSTPFNKASIDNRLPEGSNMWFKHWTKCSLWEEGVLLHKRALLRGRKLYLWFLR